jgi:hypothetical protein
MTREGTLATRDGTLATREGTLVQYYSVLDGVMERWGLRR